MAVGYEFKCDACPFAFEAWDDGDPYLIDEEGRKWHVYHPDPDCDLAVGVDLPYLCLDCGSRFKIDSRKPRTTCRRCRRARIVETFEADGRPCPKCKQGVLRKDTDHYSIS